MFFDSPDEILKIARRTGCAVFVVPETVEVMIPGALVLAPEEKTVITIEQVREVTAKLSVRQTSDVFVLVRPAEKLGTDAANAFLKNLEEPGEHIHFALVTSSASLILPTVLSRSQVYFLREPAMCESGVEFDEKTKALAKKLISAKQAEISTVAEEICKKKDGVRTYALSILGAAIEMLYKSYYITEKEVFVKKLPKFIAAYEGVAQNGHVKLQIVANLV